MSNYYSSSSIPLNPTLRSSTWNAVIIVPLLSTSISSIAKDHASEELTIDCNTHSYKSFQALFSSLSDVNSEQQQQQQQKQRQLRTRSRSSTCSPARLALRRHQSNSSTTSIASSDSSTIRNNTNNSNDNDNSNAALAALEAAVAPSPEITLVIPNSNLTPPSEFNYDDTPLKSHDWTVGSQRLLFLNGLHSTQAQDRYKSFTPFYYDCNTQKGKNGNKRGIPSHYGHFVDLYPSRGVSAIIGVLNAQDCHSKSDFQRAEQELQLWIHKFTPPLHYEKSFLGTGDLNNRMTTTTTISPTNQSHHSQQSQHSQHSSQQSHHNQNSSQNNIQNTSSLDSNMSDDIISLHDEDDFHYSPMSPKHYITKRLFLFDSFEEEVIQKNVININDFGKQYSPQKQQYSPRHNQHQQLSPKDVVAFPPLAESHIMNLHLNVVVNDLAMSIFMMIEKRIRVIDGLSYIDVQYGDHHEDIYTKSKKNFVGRNTNTNVTAATAAGNKSINNDYDNHNGDHNGDYDGEKGRSNVGALGAVLNLSFGSHDETDIHHHHHPHNNNMLFDNNDILQTHSDDDFYYSTSATTGSGMMRTTTTTTTTTSDMMTQPLPFTTTSKLSSSDTTSTSTNNNNNSVNKAKNSGNKMSLKTLAASAAKALNIQSSNNNNSTTDNNNPHDDQCILPPIEYELQTPLDTIILQTDDITEKDVNYIKQRNAARREKYTADLALLAGSVMDAYDRYTSAASKLKAVNDQLWYATALEGLATSFVAMSDTGGHGADLYLESNFQYPEKVMEAALLVTTTKSNNNNNHEHPSKIDKSKTTMPEAVSALLEQACDIISRHIKLSSIYSELLLKMAWYISELEGLHLLCRWGEGFAGGGDDHDDSYSIGSSSGQQKQRWEMTSVSKIDLNMLKRSGKLDALLCNNVVLQCRRFTELLHCTASNGGLDAYTRAGVSARCAQLCLKGVLVPQWCQDGYYNDSSTYRRQKFTRKAAYFSVLAAESMSQCKVTGAQKSAAGFWAAASQLYSKEGNKFDGNLSYAWACLRAAVLNGMSVHGGLLSSEVATNELLHLLSEITPDSKQESSKSDEKSQQNQQSVDKLRETKSTDSHSRPGDANAVTKKLNRKPESSKNSKNLLTKNPLLSQVNSQILSNQYEWLNNDKVPLLILPLIEPSTMVLVSSEEGKMKLMKKNVKNYHILPPLLSLDCVINDMSYDVCITAQKRCMSHLSKLRAAISTLSHTSVMELCGMSCPASFLHIESAKIIKSESHLLMDKVKAAGFVGNMTTSAATFYNPFEKKLKETTGENIITLVAEGEERIIMVKVGNHLSVPLVIPCCQLTFDKPQGIDIEAPSLSFTIPPKTKEYCINFPFIVVSASSNVGNPVNDTSNIDTYAFSVTGLRVAVNNRFIYIPFPTEKDSLQSTNLVPCNKQIPESLSTYKGRIKKKLEEEKKFAVELEAVPAQPKLLLSFTNAPTPLIDGATVPVHLSDGEIYSIPSLCLENDLGLGSGNMERLQIIAVGLPGLPEEVLFDSDELAKALEEEEEDRFSDTKSEDSFDDLMESDGLPPLKMKCSADGLSLGSINDKSKSLGEGSIVTLQVAATHDMGNQLQNGGNIRIRFRYRGPSPMPGVEIWRKREIALQIVRVKGPRISSLTFRSDLSWGSEYADLCRSLSLQKSKMEQIPNRDTSKIVFSKQNDAIVSFSPPTEFIVEDNLDEIPDAKNVILKRIGHHSGVFVSKDDIILLIVVTNNTNSTIILSNRLGNVCGFVSSPMPTVRVTSGVSVKIPVVIPRIECLDSNGHINDIATELVTRTALQWESEVVDPTDKIFKRMKRQGRVRIPSKCLRELIEGNNYFATRICKAPIVIDVSFDDRPCDNEEILEFPGCTIDAKVNVTINNWVPAEISSTCSLTIEFVCAKKDTGKSDIFFQKHNNGKFFWCGQLRKTFLMDNKKMDHTARLCILKPGEYVASACVKISSLDKRSEEIWWAPSSKSIKVQTKKQ